MASARWRRRLLYLVMPAASSMTERRSCGLRRQDLADAALLDDGVGFGAESAAHEDVLDVAEAGLAAVDQIFAFAGAEKAAGDGDFAWFCGLVMMGNFMDFVSFAGLLNYGAFDWRGRGRRGLRATGSTSTIVTEAMPTGLRALVPAKMTSSMRPPRRLLADCSPSTQLMASLRLDLPQPLGPTTAAIPPPLKRSSVRSQKDLKPWSSTFFKFQHVRSRSPLEEYNVFILPRFRRM